jgi:Undecaprenyl-phosphate glucose phosphotransferase
MLLDGAVVASSGLIALWIEREAVAATPAGLVSHCSAVLLSSVTVVCALQHASAYEFPHRKEQVRRAIAMSLWVVACLVAAAKALGLDRHFALPWAGVWLCVAAVALAVERCLVGHVLFRLIKKGRVRHRVVIIPAAKSSLLIEQRLRASRELGLEVIGFVDDRLGASLPASVPRERVLGDTRTLFKMIRDNEVEEVVIGLPWTATVRVQRLLTLLSEAAVRVSLAAGPATSDLSAQCIAALGEVPVVRLCDRPLAGLAQGTKWLEDAVLAPLILLMVVPLLTIIAAAIKLDSPGPVLFRQTRVGFNGRSFMALKFRTMYVEAADLEGRRQAVRNDPRVTRVGAWLRKTSLDELPQLVNVLRGEMSLVGPRPHAPGTTVEGRAFHDAVSRYGARHRVKPGITGWAQVNGWRGETDLTVKLEERLRHDLYYIDHWTIWLDLMILMRTLLIPFRHRNAY